MSRQLLLLEETGVPGENNPLYASHSHLSDVPFSNSASGERLPVDSRPTCQKDDLEITLDGIFILIYLSIKVTWLKRLRFSRGQRSISNWSHNGYMYLAMLNCCFADTHTYVRVCVKPCIRRLYQVSLPASVTVYMR